MRKIGVDHNTQPDIVHAAILALLQVSAVITVVLC